MRNEKVMRNEKIYSRQKFIQRKIWCVLGLTSLFFLGSCETGDNDEDTAFLEYVSESNPLGIHGIQIADDMIRWNFSQITDATRLRFYVNGKYHYNLPGDSTRYHSTKLKPGEYSLAIEASYADGTKEMSKPGYGTISADFGSGSGSDSGSGSGSDPGKDSGTPPPTDRITPPSTKTQATSLEPSGPIVIEKSGKDPKNPLRRGGYHIKSPNHAECGILLNDIHNVTIHDVNIEHAGAGICIFNSTNIRIERARVVNTIKKAGPHCRDGVSVSDCKLKIHRNKNPEKLYPVDSHNNIWIKKSKGVTIDTVYVEKGESGLFAHQTSGLLVDNFQCRDIRGPYWRGQCVMVTKSHGAEIKNFYAQQFLSTSSGHDTISAFDSVGVDVINGLIDGNYSRNGVGVIADKSAHGMTVKNVDIIHTGTGVNAWSGDSKKSDNGGTVPNDFTAENVRVRDSHCDITWRNIPGYGPSSGGTAFALHPKSKGSRFINSQYARHCRNWAVFGGNHAEKKDIRKEDFKVKAPPINMNFPWLKK